MYAQVLRLITIDALKPQKIVVNCGNGAAGPTFDAIAEDAPQLGGAPLRNNKSASRA